MVSATATTAASTLMLHSAGAQAVTSHADGEHLLPLFARELQRRRAHRTHRIAALLCLLRHPGLRAPR
jgi:hypothetical protein